MQTCKILRSLINSLEYDQPTRANNWRVAKASRRLLFHSLFAAAAGSRVRALSLASEVREHVDAKSGCRCGRASCSSLAITQIGSMISCLFFIFFFFFLLVFWLLFLVCETSLLRSGFSSISSFYFPCCASSVGRPPSPRGRDSGHKYAVQFLTRPSSRPPASVYNYV